MDIHTFTEMAYRNGYNDGIENFAEILKKKNFLTIAENQELFNVVWNNVINCIKEELLKR